MKNKLLTGLVIILLITVNLGINALKGSGNLISEERPLSNFHIINLNCDANLKLTIGSKHTAKIQADDNVLPQIETVVKRGELTISIKGIVTESTIQIDLIMENVSKINVNSAGSLLVASDLNQDNLELKIIGAGNIQVNADSKFIFSKIIGSGRIDIKGNADMHEIELSGSGTLDAFNLNTDKSKIKIVGEGIANVNVIDNLEITVTGPFGNGNIQFKGSPKIKADINGLANILSVD